MVDKHRAFGGTPDGQFMYLLRAKVLEHHSDVSA